MSETYKIIMDEDKLKEFITWLPDCKENEQFYYCLFARRKYVKHLEEHGVPHIRSDKGQLRRGTSTKDRLFDKIAQLECKVGAFKFDGIPVPQESLAFYLSVNPRDLWRATVRSIGQLAKVLECSGKNSNPHAEVMSEIQKSAGTRKYVMFDIDEKNEDTINDCIKICNGYCDVTETRGGYHVFVHKDKIDKITDKLWYKKIDAYADQSGDGMTVPWGTYQGSWTSTDFYRFKEDPSIKIEI